MVETDASIQGLGAVLSQWKEDHPIAYASHALTPGERNYGITELETLAVVWAIRAYLYSSSDLHRPFGCEECGQLQESMPSGGRGCLIDLKDVNSLPSRQRECLSVSLSSRPCAPAESVAETEAQVLFYGVASENIEHCDIMTFELPIANDVIM